MRVPVPARLLLVTLACLAVAACGGGSGDDAPSATACSGTCRRSSATWGGSTPPGPPWRARSTSPARPAADSPSDRPAILPVGVYRSSAKGRHHALCLVQSGNDDGGLAGAGRRASPAAR